MALWEQRLCRRAAARSAAPRHRANLPFPRTGAIGAPRPRGQGARACAPLPIDTQSGSRPHRSRGGRARQPPSDWRRRRQRPRASPWVGRSPRRAASRSRCGRVRISRSAVHTWRWKTVPRTSSGSRRQRHRWGPCGRVDQRDNRLDPRARLALGRPDARAREAASDLLGEFGVRGSPNATRHTPAVGGGDHQPAERGVGERVADGLARRPAPGLRRRHAEQVVGALVDAAGRAEARAGDRRRDVGALGELAAESLGAARVGIGVRRRARPPATNARRRCPAETCDACASASSEGGRAPASTASSMTRAAVLTASAMGWDSATGGAPRQV